jgi:hypothetical protein
MAARGAAADGGAIVDRGVSKTVVSQAFGIPVTTLSEWARRYRKYGTDTSRWAEEGARPPWARVERSLAADRRRATLIEEGKTLAGPASAGTAATRQARQPVGKPERPAERVPPKR